MMQIGSRIGVKPLKIFRMPMAGPARRDSTPGCRCVAGRPRCRMSALGTVVDGMSLSFLGIGMESLVEGTDLRGADQLWRGRTNVGALGVLLPGPVEPKDAKSQRRREPERTAGFEEADNVNKSPWREASVSSTRWHGRKGPRSKAAIKTPHTLSVKIKIDTSVMILC